MKSNYWLLTVIFALVALPGKAGEWIRINQLGYLPQSVKVAVFMSEEGTNVENYSLIDAFHRKGGAYLQHNQGHRQDGRHKEYLPVELQ